MRERVFFARSAQDLNSRIFGPFIFYKAEVECWT
jgi:hypothetical protein